MARRILVGEGAWSWDPSVVDWQGNEVEGVPPQYQYEKIECYLQGVRDYLKFLKRGYGRTAHLTSIDIRNGRLTRADALKMIEEYDGKRPPSLDLFLDFVEALHQLVDFGPVVIEHRVEDAM